MRPGPRIQATIDLLEAVETNDDAADRIVAAFFRRRRYAGAKDRAAITKLFYALMRRRAWLEWRLVNIAAGGYDGPRHIVLAQLADGGVPDEELTALFDGSDHAPAPLSLEELSLVQSLRRPPSGTPPPPVAGNYPSWLHGALERRFGADLSAEMAALNDRAPVDLRVNILRTDRTTLLERLRAEGFAAEPTPFSRWGIRLAESPRLDAHPLYREGLVEIQDEGSQIVAALVGARPGDRIVDYCAGAGGKSLALAAAMGNHGEVVACDVSSGRLRALDPRVHRAGADIVKGHVLSESGGDFDGAKFDRVLLDVPCSGSGAWRRQPSARWKLSRDKLNKFNELQSELLVKGSDIVAPGGTLIYATCSVLREEGEDRIAQFLAQSAGFTCLDINAVWSAVLDGEPPCAGPFLSLSPHACGTDGFFAAVMRRDPV
ncbi:MAG: RsmB/NOP family class I SAM-dependent RNA methyltransferase [Proteobacteria bacterium]|nr:RsmB/NOP family class I SAM-dependent RNA methyltransferase [Pseudomonadota bacterium]MDA1059147.1 RsmB/NOP family class I SAM-dependent RNA methyltransferase [Pseudomonadota bacterium]